jgi:hypothetical protein
MVESDVERVSKGCVEVMQFELPMSILVHFDIGQSQVIGFLPQVSTCRI